MQNMLQSFLDAGMLNMVEEDEKFTHLQNAAQDLAAKPPKIKTDVINYTLVALDPEASPEEPVFEKVEAAIKKHWQTFRSKFPDVPRQLLRAIIFETLRIRGEKDPATAAIIWWTGASYLPYANLGREREVCSAFLREMGDIAETQAAEEWSSSYEYVTPEIPPFDIKLATKAYGVNDESLTQHLSAAVGPQNADGTTTGADRNTHWPTNNPQAWAYKFAPRAAKGITEVVNASLTAMHNNLSQGIKQAGTSLNDHAAAINEAIRGAIDQVAQSTKANERRSQLLWWRQTLYSPTLKQGYREVDRVIRPLLMSYDLYQQITDYHPQSVEYLLSEAVSNLSIADESEASVGITLFEFCKQLQSNRYAPELKKELKANVSDESGRIPLLRFVKNVLAGEQFDADTLTERVGVKSDTKIGFEKVAVWLLRDLQANHLATQKQ